jgi:hypothetical protein
VIRHAITPLRLIFWGGLICLLDVKISSVRNGYGFQFDLLNDAVGAVMISIGVFSLAAIRVDDRYERAMTFVKIMSVLMVLDALREHIDFPEPLPLQIVMLLLGLARLAATVVFCVAMRRLSARAGLWRSEASWRTTTVLFVVIYVVPLGLLNLVSIPAVAMGERIHLELGPVAFLLLPVFLIPVIHLFVSTSRMRREAEESPPRRDETFEKEGALL